MDVVFDTNIFISAFLVPGSKAERAFILARHSRFTLYSSVQILTETANTLRRKFDQPEEDIQEALKLISRAATILRPKTRVVLLEDAPDNRILECALEATADAIVSGDRHLLQLKRFQRIPILRLADFLRMFPDEQA